MCTKICGFCRKELPETLEFFATKGTGIKKVFQWQCRDCQKNYRKEHYERNREKYILKAKNNRQKLVDDFQDFKKTLKCNRCSENRWWVLEFHHTNPNEKEGEISLLVRKGSKEKLFKEIKKCEVLCCNCHRNLHYEGNADNA